MAVETLIRQLLEAGVHFGHQTKRWNPRMKSFIFGERSGIYIIDLQQTAQRLKTACDFLQDLTERGEYILFVGTKKQAQESVAEEAQRCGMFFVNERWLGGTLTNFATIRKSVERLQELEKKAADENSAALTKKEKALLEKEIGRLRKKLSGIVQMKKLPNALVVVDPKKEESAVREAKRLSIPVIALLDTNCDPTDINFPIPGNDDALRSIKLVVSLIADSVLSGRQSYLQIKKTKKEAEEKEQAKAQAVSADKPEDETEELIIEDAERKIKETKEQQLKKKPKTEGSKRVREEK
ncbi:MAG: 30S ribosomal protein S2 [Candidatus Omnitrophica bacterium]|nr:30S ribosomal protein S2 [Candidatus Omnitrophota bacterium]